MWILLVYGLPSLRRVLPSACERWSLAGGICRESAQQRLARLDAWVQRVLRPLPRHARVQEAAEDAVGAFKALEQALRRQFGDERVNEALRGADLALSRLERALGDTGNVRAKVADVPGNAKALLERARASFEKLRGVLHSAGRRAEDVSSAVRETKDALDALSSALPKTE